MIASGIYISLTVIFLYKFFVEKRAYLINFALMSALLCVHFLISSPETARSGLPENLLRYIPFVTIVNALLLVITIVNLFSGVFSLKDFKPRFIFYVIVTAAMITGSIFYFTSDTRYGTIPGSMLFMITDIVFITAVTIVLFKSRKSGTTLFLLRIGFLLFIICLTLITIVLLTNLLYAMPILVLSASLSILITGLALLYPINNVSRADSKKEEITVPQQQTKAEQAVSQTPQPAKTDEEAETIFDLGELIKKQTDAFNALGLLDRKIVRAAAGNVMIKGRLSEARMLLKNIFSYITTFSERRKDLYITLIKDSGKAVMTIGEFDINMTDRAGSSEKIMIGNINRNAQLLGGKLSITHEKLYDEYAVFKIIFEQAPFTVTPEQPAPHENENRSDNKGGILLFSDDITITKVLDSIFNGSLTVSTASDRDTALDLLINGDFDALILASGVHGENELLFYESDKIPSLNELPVIVISFERPRFINSKTFRIIKPVHILPDTNENSIRETIFNQINSIKTFKKRNIKEIDRKIDSVQENENQPAKQQSVLKKFEESAARYNLSPAEKTLLLHLIKGTEYREIARTMKLTDNDLLARIDKLMIKFNVKTRIELIDRMLK